MARKAAKPLARLSDVFGNCRNNLRPITILGATPYGCLGLDAMIGNLQYLSAIDCLVGMNRHAFAPESQRQAVFHTAVETCNDLLRHQEVKTHLKANGPGMIWPSDADEDTEQLSRALDVSIALAPAMLRRDLSNDLSARALLAKSGVPFVPSVVAPASSIADVTDAASRAKLGSELVVQYDDAQSGKSTHIIRKAKDIDALTGSLTGQSVTISKYIAHSSIAVECVVTKGGTFMGPIMIPHRGSHWIGALVSAPDTDYIRTATSTMIKKLGAALAQCGFSGVFTARFYVEEDTEKLYLRRIEPGLTPLSQLTHFVTAHYTGLPLHAFHVLAFMDISSEIDVAAINKRWAEHDQWSIAVPYHTGTGMEFITKSAASGIYKMTNGEAEISAPSVNPADVSGTAECLFLRTLGTGTYRQDSLELGLVMMRGNGFDVGRAGAWINALMSQTSTVNMSGTSLPKRAEGLQRISLF